MAALQVITADDAVLFKHLHRLAKKKQAGQASDEEFRELLRGASSLSDRYDLSNANSQRDAIREDADRLIAEVEAEDHDQ